MFTIKFDIQMLLKDMVRIMYANTSLVFENEKPVPVIRTTAFYNIAEQILSAMQSGNNVPPQLQQNDVSGRSEQLPPSGDDVWAAADNYVFVENGMKWSNNDNTAGDNFRSFIDGAKWAIQKLSGNCH